jgi:hypothetical protein
LQESKILKLQTQAIYSCHFLLQQLVLRQTSSLMCLLNFCYLWFDGMLIKEQEEKYITAAL